jgi:hypothetical protein
MLTIPRELAGLRRISLSDQDVFVAAAEEEGQKSWLYYFPFLYGFSLAESQTLLWEIFEGSICVYFLRVSDTSSRLSLYLPPFPFNARALAHALRRISDYNEDHSAKITWVEEGQAKIIRQTGFELEPVEEEYIYDAEAINLKAGPYFYRLRRNLSKASRIEGLQICSYEKTHEAQCLQLLKSWRQFKQNDRGVRVTGKSYMRSCLLDASSFGSRLLKGEVILINDRLCGFAFGGRITSRYGSLYVAVADHQVAGLGYLQRHHLMMSLEDIRYFNDSSDLGQPGLAEVKKSFKPVAMNSLYRARTSSSRLMRGAALSALAAVE